jgi:hypothetical protein
LPRLNELVANRKLTPSEIHEACVKVVGQEIADRVHNANRKYRKRFPTNPIANPNPTSHPSSQNSPQPKFGKS